MTNLNKNEDRITQIMNDPDELGNILQVAINEALLKHKQAGNPICIWENGKVVWIDPENISVKKINL